MDKDSILNMFFNDVFDRNIKWCKPYIEVSSKEFEIKYFLSLIWSNMTANDFADPQYYLQRYLSFLRDTTFKDLNITTHPIIKLNNCHIEVSNIEEKSCFETPFAFKIAVVDDDNQYFYLPDVKYGINEQDGYKVAYIYAIQYDSKAQAANEQNRCFKQKINRLLYKVNQDLPKEELDKKMSTQSLEGVIEENIVDVMPSSLLSLTIALSLFANK